MDERTVPILPCSDIDVVAAFYEALGFRRTYRQVKPNPHVVMERGAIGLHFAGIDEFVPANSYGSCIIVTDDADALYAAFAAGIRAKEGRLPVAGIPRFTRPRKKWDVVHGFSVVDPGGNWIRITQRGSAAAAEEGDEGGEKVTGLAKALLTAARLGDSHGDTALAVTTLDRALAKFAAAPAPERVAALVYRAELALAMTDPAAAHHSLAAARAIVLDASEREAIAPDLQRLAELEADLP